MNISKWFSTLSSYSSIEKVGFEDVKYAIKNTDTYIVINTLGEREQDLLIKGTIHVDSEEHVINHFIENYMIHKKSIIIYGKHSCDDSTEKKYYQITGLGFNQVAIYTGGLFDWLLLQEIYGSDEFPTIGICKDLLKYRPPKKVGDNPHNLLLLHT